MFFMRYHHNIRQKKGSYLYYSKAYSVSSIFIFENEKKIFLILFILFGFSLLEKFILKSLLEPKFQEASIKIMLVIKTIYTWCDKLMWTFSRIVFIPIPNIRLFVQLIVNQGAFAKVEKVRLALTKQTMKVILIFQLMKLSMVMI